jgi:hypothetical protein
MALAWLITRSWPSLTPLSRGAGPTGVGQTQEEKGLVVLEEPTEECPPDGGQPFGLIPSMSER